MPENSRRSAHATIRGYLYQTCLGVLRWLDLQPNEVLVCEGDEDLDRHLLDGTVVSEQVKAYSGRLGLGDQAVLESLFNFLCTYVALRREDKDRKFIFTTTAEPRRKTGLDFDLLEKWREGIRTRKVTSAVRSLFKPKKENPHRKEIEETRAWLDSQPEGWVGFMNAVEWTFKAPDLDDIRRTIQSHLARGEKTRNLDSDLFTDRLVVHVLEASSKPDISARTLTPAALSKLVEEDLNRWATSPHGRRIREAFDEAARIQDLLNTGTDKLRDLKPGTLLTAAHEVIPFDEAGRREELDLLADWCQEAEPRSVLLLTGEGGSGKTRLMIEWCRRLRHQGWHAGFLRRDRQAIELDPFLKGTAPRLVVVDYAETQMAVVQPLLQKLASTEPGTGPKVRVVLLARRQGNWWRNLSEEDGEIARLPKRSEVITPLIPSDVEKRQEIFHRAMQGFAAQTGQPVPQKPSLPDVSHEDFERVLFLHMATMAALEGTRIGSASEALHATLVHERRFWKKQVSDLRMPGDLAPLLEQALEIAVATVTLVQGCPTEQEAEALVVRCLSDLPLEKRHPTTVLGLLRTLYGGSQGENARFIDPLQPDLLGEELVEETLTRDPNLLARILEQCSPRAAYFTLIVLLRLVRRISTAEKWIEIFAGELEGKGTQEIWATLRQLCDEQEFQRSVPLRQIAQIAMEEHLKLFIQHSFELSDVEQAEYGRLLNNYGLRLRDLGRREDALQALSKSVSIFHQIAPNRPEFTSNLAISLTNLGNSLSDLRRPEDGLRFLELSVQIHQQLARHRPDFFLPDLAMSLSDMGKILSELGRREDALEAMQEAVRIYRQLSQLQPDTFLPNLAVSLSNLSSVLSELGRREIALRSIEEAVEIYRPLTKQRPDIFLPDLARALTNLGKILSELGKQEDALQATQQAVDIYQPLAQSRPYAFLPDLARSLNNLGPILSNLERQEEALRVTEEAIRIYRQLAQEQPDVFVPDLALSLNNLGVRLSTLGLSENALQATQEAVRSLSPFFLRFPAAFAPLIATMVRNYVEQSEAAGHEPDQALLTPILEALQSLSPTPPPEDQP